MIMVDFDISGLGPGSMDLDFEAPRPRIYYDFNDFADVGSWIDTISPVSGLELGAVFC